MARPLLLALALLAAPLAHAQAEGPPGAPLAGDVGPFYLEDAVDATFDLPVAVAFAPGGRMFVVEKRGVVWVVEDGAVRDEPFIDLRDEVLDHHDRGLLGLAVDPDFATNRRVYLAYTVDHGSTADAPRTDAFARVTRYAGRADDPSIADSASRRVLLGRQFSDGIPACYYSHSIGTLAFGSDGSLFVGTGDGASYNTVDAGGLYPDCFGDRRLDPSEDVGAFRSQRLESLAGKILRIDPRNGLGLSSNPFWTGDGRDNASRVWALGVRNPFRFVVDPRGGRAHPGHGRPGRVYVADVGWSTYEDLHLVRGGENLGWPCVEGPVPNAGYQAATPATNGCDGPLAGAPDAPHFAWHHHDDALSNPPGRTGASIVGGAIVGGSKYPPAFDGALVYGDFVHGWTAAVPLRPSGVPLVDRLVGTGVGAIAAYAFDAESEYLHLVDIGAGRVRRLRWAGEVSNAPPVVRAAASPSQGGLASGGLRVQLSPDGSFDPDGDALAYAWTFGDGGTSSERAPVHTYTAPGTYTATVTASDGASEAAASVEVVVREGAVPSVRITSPTAVTRGATGAAVRLAADVSDPDQDAADLFVRWTVVQVHDGHVHPDVFQAADAEAWFTVPEHGSPSDRVSYRVRAEVRDATGLTSADEAWLFLGDDVGEVDMTAAGEVTASVPEPADGRGAWGLGVVRDGVTPVPGADLSRQFATFTGGRDRDEDWIQVSFHQSHRFTRLSFQEGLAFADGGWFEAPPRVQVRRGGMWHDVVDLTVAPAYRADDGWPFDRYELAFAPAEGDAVRLVGPPGGSAGFVTVGELRVWALGDAAAAVPLPAPWASQDVGAPSVSGRAAAVGDAVVVTGGGDFWNATDRGHLAWRPLDGAGALVARVEAMTPGIDWAKAGLTVRQSADPDAAHVSVVLSNIGVHVQTRRQPGAPSEGVIDLWGRATPTWLRLDRTGATVTAWASDDGATWQTLAEVEVPALDGAAVAGLVVSASDYGEGQVATARFAHVALAEALPAPWTSADVGTPAGAGVAYREGGALVVTGGGDIWNAADGFHSAHQPLDGDGAITARVETPAGPWDWSKAGLMIRASAAADAPNAWLGLSQRGLHLQRRAAPGEPTTTEASQFGVGGPLWLRLVRTGTEVAAFRSADGEAWDPVGTVDVPGLGAGPALVGLAVSASDYGDGVTAEGRFASVVVESGAEARRAPAAHAAMPFGIEGAYPNPAVGQATVRLSASEGAVLTLLDVLGRRVLEHRLAAPAGEVRLDLAGVPAGTYVLRLHDATGEVAVRTLAVVR